MSYPVRMCVCVHMMYVCDARALLLLLAPATRHIFCCRCAAVVDILLSQSVMKRERAVILFFFISLLVLQVHILPRSATSSLQCCRCENVFVHGFRRRGWARPLPTPRNRKTYQFFASRLRPPFS